MNVSGPIRIFALVGGLAALALGAWFFLLAPTPGAADAPVEAIQPLHPVKKGGAAPAKPRPAKTRPARAKPASTPKPAAKAKPAPKTRPATPRPTRVPNPEGLPVPVARALAANPVVVVTLYDPESKLDRLSVAEARAGAARAGVAFVALNALRKQHSEPLTRKLGVLSAPAFFLYRRPGELVMRIDGFADRDLVAQAARNATQGGAR